MCINEGGLRVFKGSLLWVWIKIERFFGGFNFCGGSYSFLLTLAAWCVLWFKNDGYESRRSRRVIFAGEW